MLHTRKKKIFCIVYIPSFYYEPLLRNLMNFDLNVKNTYSICITSFHFVVWILEWCLFQMCDRKSGIPVSSLNMWLVFNNVCFFKSGWSSRCSFWVKELIRTWKGNAPFDSMLMYIFINILIVMVKQKPCFILGRS